MPRSGGVYTLPQPSFTSGATVSSAAVNSNFSDIASALTDSVAADGQTTMTGPLIHSNGTAPAPSVTFASDKTTGIYLPAAGEIGFAVGGASGGLLTSSGLSGITFTSPTLASATFTGTLTVNAATVTFGAGAANAMISGLGMNATIQYVIDGGGSAPSTGVKGFLEIPFNCTVTRWTLVADQSGSAVVDVWMKVYSGFPPTVANTITGSALPTLSSVQNNQSSTLTGWTTALVAGDILAFNVNSATTCTRLTLSLFVTRTAA